ncbi:MAG: riboflavin kinase, partial [Acetobacteraceae bacterium]
ARRAEELGIGASVVPLLSDAEGPISSTRIRRLLQEGYPERAAAELGRPWTIRGPVLEGDRRGRTLGFPTANMALGRHLEPARGVYAVSVRLPDATEVAGVANVGRRPTVDGASASRLETHLFDFSADLYGQDLAVGLKAYLRPERRFADFSALRAQIAADALEARRLLDLPQPASS